MSAQTVQKSIAFADGSAALPEKNLFSGFADSDTKVESSPEKSLGEKAVDSVKNLTSKTEEKKD